MRGRVIALIALACTVGCGSEERSGNFQDSDADVDSDSDGDADADDYCGGIERQLERAYRDCCAFPDDAAAHWAKRTTDASCRPAFSQWRVEVDPDLASACLVEVTEAISDCLDIRYLPASHPDTVHAASPCDHMLEGLLDQGESCRDSRECQDGLYCEWQGNFDNSFCLPVAGEGAPCAPRSLSMGSLPWCADGLDCNPETETCEQSPAPGDACSEDWICEPTSYCGAESVTCVSRGGPDAPCDNYLQCVDGSCGEDGTCGRASICFDYEYYYNE